MPIRIQTPVTKLDIQLTNEENWVTCDLHLSSPSLSCACPGYLEVADLRRFLSELQEMYATPGRVIQATLNGIEPWIFIKLTSNITGIISVKYELKNFQIYWKLTGGFGIDQSYLPYMISDIKNELHKMSHPV